MCAHELHVAEESAATTSRVLARPTHRHRQFSLLFLLAFTVGVVRDDGLQVFRPTWLPLERVLVEIARLLSHLLLFQFLHQFYAHLKSTPVHTNRPQ